MDYIDYDIVVGSDLKITASCEGISDEEGELKIDKNEIESAMKELANEQSTVDRNFIKFIGTRLAEALFPPLIKQHFYTVKSKAANKGIRIHLRFESPEISGYPWESLYENNKYMAGSIDTSLTRCVFNGISSRKPFDKPLKILVIGSNPSKLGLSSVQVNREIEIIKDSLQEEITKGTIKLDPEPIGEVERIMNKLTNEQYNIIHFIGHGVFKDGTGSLALENSDGGLELYDQERIGQLFMNQLALGLVVLNACQGADISTSGAFTGLAPELIKMGIPSVIAMKYSITNQTAKLFSHEFYKNLPRMPIDENIQNVRHRILVDPNTSPMDFIIPVLFTNSPDLIIFSPRDASAEELMQSPALNIKIGELKDIWDELLTGESDAINVKDFWLLIWEIYKDYNKELSKRPLRKLVKMISVIPGLIREREEAQDAALPEKARGIDQTILRNYRNFMETIE